MNDHIAYSVSIFLIGVVVGIVIGNKASQGPTVQQGVPPNKPLKAPPELRPSYFVRNRPPCPPPPPPPKS